MSRVLRVFQQQLIALIVTFAVYVVIWRKRILRGSHNERNALWDKITRIFFLGTLVGPWMNVFRKWAVWLPCLAYGYTYLDGSETHGGRPNPAIRGFWRSVSKWWQRKVKSSALIFTAKDELDPKRQFVLGVHPHAALPVAAIMNFVSDDWNATAPDFPKENVRVLVASFCFYLPVLRELYLGAGFVDASKFSMQQCLNDGHNVMLFPGGASEAKFCGPDKDRLVLRSRRGFVRVAIEHGIPLVPCYTFGESDVIGLGGGGPSLESRLFKFQNAMQSVLGLNIDPRMPLVPREDVPVCMVVGSPMQMPHDPNPSDELVTLHLERYMSELAKLHKQWQPPDSKPKPLQFLPEAETAMP